MQNHKIVNKEKKTNDTNATFGNFMTFLVAKKTVAAKLDFIHT